MVNIHRMSIKTMTFVFLYLPAVCWGPWCVGLYCVILEGVSVVGFVLVCIYWE